MNGQPLADMAAASDSMPTGSLLEAHTYSGGLRVEVLGQAQTRPDWAPPPDYIGFRNEVKLLPGDYAVEFARFLYRGRKVTWVALFRHAVDEVYGDRQNHAGVGVWLLEQDIVHPDPLLRTLRQFADVVHAGSAELHGSAHIFQRDHLPSYLSPALDLPAPLAGWAFSTTPIAEGPIFIAADTSSDRAWAAAADQILRATLLPPASPRDARALILVSSVADPTSVPASARPAPRFSVAELIKALPNALANVLSHERAAQAAAAETQMRYDAREADLAEAARHNDQLRADCEKLELQLEKARSELQASEPARQWSALRSELRDIRERVISVDQNVGDIRRDLSRRPATTQGGSQTGSSKALGAGAGDARRSIPPYLWVVGILLLAMIALAIYLSLPSPTTKSSPSTEILTVDSRDEPVQLDIHPR